MTAARHALWRDSEALSAAAGPTLSPRMRRLAVRNDRALALVDMGQAPLWASSDAAERGRLTRLTGAVLVSQRWSREISGAVLGRAAEAVGDEALEDLINLPAVVAPEVADPAAGAGDATAIDRLGASALIAASEAGAGLVDRLAHLFPAGVGAPVKPSAAALALRTAEGLHRQADDPGAPA